MGRDMQAEASRKAVARAANAVAGGTAAAGKQMGGTTRAPPPVNCTDPSPAPVDACPSDVACSELPAACLQCSFNCSCVYGEQTTVTCVPRPGLPCKAGRGGQAVTRQAVCQYCWQTPHWQHSCTASAHCQATATPRKTYVANCTAHPEVACLGRRRFLKSRPCDWTAGYSWATALCLSVTLGGFGADRFYLGHWQEGIGKLFSFGGLGVWTLMDVVLIAIGYLGPADGSLYI